MIQTALEKTRAYYSGPNLIPTLNAVNGSERQQRSERREACVSLIETLLHYTDLTTLRVCVPSSGGVAGLKMQTLADRAGLNLRRTERAAHDLVHAGLITVHAIAKPKDGGFVGLAAIRTVSRELFDLLGLSAWLKYERRKAAQRRLDECAKASKKQLAKTVLAVKSLAVKTKTTQSSNPGTDTQPKRSKSPQHITEHIARMREGLT